MIVLYENLVADSTVSAFSENPYYLWNTALKDTRLSRVGRTIDDAAQWIKFDLGSAKAVTSIIINAHNITTGATVKLEGNATDVWTSPTVSETLTVADVIFKQFASASLRYWRITIDDASNPDTYIQIGSVYLGTSLTMPGFNPEGSFFTQTNSSATRSLSRQLYGQTRTKYKIAECSFEYMTATETANVKTFLDFVDVTTPFYLLIWENDPTIEPPIYVSLDDYPEVTKAPGYGLSYNMKIKIGECF